MSKALKSKDIAPVITMIVSIAGVIATTVLASKAGAKAENLLKELTDENPEPTTLEKVKKVAPAYIPTAVTGALTIGSIIATTVLNTRSQASLTSSYALLNSGYHRYREHVKKIFGDDADQKVIDSIVKSECRDISLCSSTCFGSDSLDFDVDEERRLFYDSYSERYFESTLGKVLQAEYHINRNYILGGGASINEFYDFLGLEPVPNGDLIGWDFDGGLAWIDFNHRTVKLEDNGNLECNIIDFVFTPWDANENYMTRR